MESLEGFSMDINTPLEEIMDLISVTLTQFYAEDELLFLRREKKGLHERCLHAKFAHHLQNHIDQVCGTSEKWFVDCEYNSTWVPRMDEDGNLVRDTDGLIIFDESSRKELKNLNGVVPKDGMFVDIIVHRRLKSETDFFCIELKKLASDKPYLRREDFNKLQQMTNGFGYKFGFYLVLGTDRKETKVTVFTEGKKTDLIAVAI